MWTATPWTDSSLLEPISLPIVYYVDGLILNSLRTRPLQRNNHSKVRLVTTIRRSHHLPNRITSFTSTDEPCLPRRRFPFATFGLIPSLPRYQPLRLVCLLRISGLPAFIQSLILPVFGIAPLLAGFNSNDWQVCRKMLPSSVRE